MKHYLKLFVLIVAVSFQLNAKGQNKTSAPDYIGKPLPSFSLNKVLNFKEKTITSKSLKGTPYIIDFWPSWCTPCIAALPRLDSLQQVFSDKIQIISVCYNSEKDMRAIFGRMLEKKILKYAKLPAAFDSVLFKKINMGDFISVWVDAEGMLRYFSYSSSITYENINKFIEGKNVEGLNFEPINYRVNNIDSVTGSYTYNRRSPLLINHNGGPDTFFLFRSILTPYLKDIGNSGMPGLFAPKYCIPLIRLENCPLSQLFAVAFLPQADHTMWSPFNSYGKILSRPILSVSDASKFRCNYHTRNIDSLGMNKYCYELSYPDLGQIGSINPAAMDSALFYINPVKDTSVAHFGFGFPTAHSIQAQKVMQQDLINFFPYKANIEKIPYACYELVVSGDISKLKTRRGKPQNTITQFGIKLVNQKWYDVVQAIWFYNQLYIPSGEPVYQTWQIDNQKPLNETLIYDKTNIDFDIDIDLDCNMKDLPAIKKALNDYGVDLIKKETMVPALIISDK